MEERSPIDGTRGRLAVLVAGLLPALLYINTLPNSFHYDDTFVILENLYVRSLSGVWHFFVSARLISDIPLSGYRPITMATFALNYALGADDPFGYHLVNVLIHVLNTLLVFWTSLIVMRDLRVRGGRYAALAASLLFAAHPVNTQSVNYITGRSTLLVSGFSLLCFVLYTGIRREAGGRKAALLLGSLTAYACALMSKEEAIALPGLLALYELCRLRVRIDRTRLRQIVVSLLPFVMVTLGYLWLVVRALELIGDTPQARGMSENLLTQAKAFFVYLGLLALPTGLSIDHVVPTSTSLLEPVTLACVVALAGILIGASLLVRVAPIAPFGVWWCMIALVPTSTLVALKLVVNEQRMYLSAMGIMLIAGAAIGTALECAKKARRSNLLRGLVLGFAAMLAVLGFLTTRRNTEWRDPLTLWSSALEKYPRSPRANTQVARIYLEMGRFREAARLAEHAVEAAPDVVEPRVTLATAYSRMGLRRKALREARAAVDLNPASSDAQTALGVAYARLERYEEAKAAWDRALELNPQNPKARQNLEKLEGAGKPGND